ncbi:transcription factor PRE4-like [Corylus avellana]|uniref:transcription factor PRE4-like n=1 Tax=Corylus avellana TaxID=13451 RepID=UPI001E21AF07|nr:transcription factor PRE4-like [Corylus avellana]
MSTRRSSSRTSNATEEEINDLVLKLQTLLPSRHNQRRNRTPTASKVLNETCTYLKRLQKEVDDLSERLAQLLDSVDTTAVDIELIRRLLQ